MCWECGCDRYLCRDSLCAGKLKGAGTAGQLSPRVTQTVASTNKKDSYVAAKVGGWYLAHRQVGGILEGAEGGKGNGGLESTWSVDSLVKELALDQKRLGSL